MSAAAGADERSFIQSGRSATLTGGRAVSGTMPSWRMRRQYFKRRQFRSDDLGPAAEDRSGHRGHVPALGVQQALNGGAERLRVVPADPAGGPSGCGRRPAGRRRGCWRGLGGGRSVAGRAPGGLLVAAGLTGYRLVAARLAGGRVVTALRAGDGS